jgi:hypothetical protein
LKRRLSELLLAALRADAGASTSRKPFKWPKSAVGKCGADQLSAPRLIAAVHVLKVELARRRAESLGRAVDWTSASARLAAMPYASFGAWQTVPHVTVDFRDLLGKGAAVSRMTTFQKYELLLGGERARALVYKMSRNTWYNALVLGATMSTDGTELLVHAHKTSRCKRVGSDCDNWLSRMLAAALKDDPDAQHPTTRELFHVGPQYGSYKGPLLRAALDQHCFGDKNAKYVFENSKPAKVKSGDADDDCGLGPDVAELLKRDPVDFLSTSRDLTRHAFYERALRVGVLRGARTWGTLQQLLVTVVEGIDTGQSDWLFIVAGLVQGERR